MINYNDLLIPEKVKELNTTANAAKTKAEEADTKATAAKQRGDEAYTKAEQAFQSASDGKQKIATAITGKGVEASGSETFESLAGKINTISTGTPTARVDYDPSLDIVIKNNLIKEDTELLIVDVETKDCIIRDKTTNNIYWIDSAGDAILLYNKFSGLSSIYLDMKKKIFLIQSQDLLAVNLDTLVAKFHHPYYGYMYFDGPGGIVVYVENSGAGWRGKHVYDAYTGDKLLTYTVSNSDHSYDKYVYNESIDKFYRIISVTAGSRFEVYDRSFNMIYNKMVPSTSYKVFGDTLVTVSNYPSDISKPLSLYVDNASASFIMKLTDYTTDKRNVTLSKQLYNRYALMSDNKMAKYNTGPNDFYSSFGYMVSGTVDNEYLCNIDSIIKPLSIDKFYEWAVFRDGFYIKDDKTFNIMYNTNQTKYVTFGTCNTGNAKIEVITKTGFEM